MACLPLGAAGLSACDGGAGEASPKKISAQSAEPGQSGKKAGETDEGKKKKTGPEPIRTKATRQFYGTVRDATGQRGVVGQRLR